MWQIKLRVGRWGNKCFNLALPLSHCIGETANLNSPDWQGVEALVILALNCRRLPKADPAPQRVGKLLPDQRKGYGSCWRKCGHQQTPRQDRGFPLSVIHWRKLCGISWQMATVSGSRKLADELCRRAGEVRATRFEVDPELLFPRSAVVAGEEVIEAIFRFDTVNGPGVGVVRLLPSREADALPKAWTISTLLDVEKISHARLRIY